MQKLLTPNSVVKLAALVCRQVQVALFHRNKNAERTPMGRPLLDIRQPDAQRLTEVSRCPLGDP